MNGARWCQTDHFQFEAPLRGHMQTSCRRSHGRLLSKSRDARSVGIHIRIRIRVGSRLDDGT